MKTAAKFQDCGPNQNNRAGAANRNNQNNRNNRLNNNQQPLRIDNLYQMFYGGLPDAGFNSQPQMSMMPISGFQQTGMNGFTQPQAFNGLMQPQAFNGFSNPQMFGGFQQTPPMFTGFDPSQQWLQQQPGFNQQPFGNGGQTSQSQPLMDFLFSIIAQRIVDMLMNDSQGANGLFGGSGSCNCGSGHDDLQGLEFQTLPIEPIIVEEENVKDKKDD